MTRAVLLLAVAALAGCAGTPRPAWTGDAQAALALAVEAALGGDARAEAQAFDRARATLARSGQPGLLARAELLRCAAQAARLEPSACAAFEPLRADAAADDRAYADYLAGRLQPADLERLPPHHRAAARGDAGALAQAGDPFARLVAAATLLHAGRADGAVVAQAVDTASAQGWRRALLPWLRVQQRQAEAAGQGDEAARVQRRIDAVRLAR